MSRCLGGEQPIDRDLGVPLQHVTMRGLVPPPVNKPGKKLLHLHPDVVCGTVLALVSIGYLAMTRALPSTHGEPGPAFLPRLLAVALLGVAISLIVSGSRSRSTKTIRAGGYDVQDPGRTALLLVLTVVYLAVFPVLGALVATWLYTLGVALMFGTRRPLALALTPTLSTGAIFLLFEVGLGAKLPLGILG